MKGTMTAVTQCHGIAYRRTRCRAMRLHLEVSDPLRIRLASRGWLIEPGCALEELADFL